MSDIHGSASAAGADGQPGIVENIEGILKWYCPLRGHGFITPEKQQPIPRDVFVNRETLIAGGHERIFEGQKVICDAAITAKGLNAVTVELRVPTLDWYVDDRCLKLPGVPILMTNVPVRMECIKAARGFAFLAATDGRLLSDIFLLSDTARESGLVDLPGAARKGWLRADVGREQSGRYVAVGLRLAGERLRHLPQPKAPYTTPDL